LVSVEEKLVAGLRSDLDEWGAQNYS
jgi:hypothetical protein